MRRLLWGLRYAAAPVVVLGLLSCSSSQALPDPPATEQRVSGRNGWYLSVPDRPISLEKPISVWVMARRAGELTLEVRMDGGLVEPVTLPVSANGIDKWMLVPILGHPYESPPGFYDIQLLGAGGEVLAEAQMEATS